MYSTLKKIHDVILCHVTVLLNLMNFYDVMKVLEIRIHLSIFGKRSDMFFLLYLLGQ